MNPAKEARGAGQIRAPGEGATEWVHVPTPGDHYSPKTGSAVISVIREMVRCRTAATGGGRSRVLVADGTWDGFDDGAREEIAFRRLGTPPWWAKAVDCTVGAVMRRRPVSSRQYVDVAAALGQGFEGVVFVHNEPAGVEPIARRCPRAKVVLWAHNDLFRSYTVRQASRVLGLVHRIVCCSGYIAGRIRAVVGDDERIGVALNGVDAEVFRPADPPVVNDPPVVLFVGRMVPEKGVDVLLKAARRLVGRGVRLRLRLVGSKHFNGSDPLTSYERGLRRLAKGLGDAVEFLPFQPRAKVVELYRSADIHCVPSNWDDPCPLTVLEGMACGLATVAARRGGIPEEAGDAAAYFDPPDDAGLAEQLEKVIVDGALRERRRVDAREQALQLSWSTTYAAVTRVVEAVGSDRR